MGVAQFSILLVEDDEANRASIERILKNENYQVSLAENGREGIRMLETQPFDLILTDLKMPLVDGMEMLRHAQKQENKPDVIMMTAHGTIETAVEAMQKGATDFLTKPFKKDVLLSQVQKVLQKKKLQNENQRLRAQLDSFRKQNELIGQHASIKNLKRIIRQVAPSESTVLLLGESGVGKEVAAHEIVYASERAEKPFIKINCAALPESLLEAELFGHEKGAFTGALQAKPGRFEQAHGGTLFLDEIGDISLTTQVKLLRAIQEKEVQRLGGTKTISCDVRIIAATNKNLTDAVEKKLFREDLYFRLNVIEIKLPPLRERVSDIPTLAVHFLNSIAQRDAQIEITPDAIKKLQNYDWPGNVRELKNVLERAYLMRREPIIHAENILFSQHTRTQREGVWIPDGLSMREIEDTIIQQRMQFYEGDKNQVAQSLKIGLRTLYRKLGDESEPAD